MQCMNGFHYNFAQRELQDLKYFPHDLVVVAGGRGGGNPGTTTLMTVSDAKKY